jgi:hypothetical protein
MRKLREMIALGATIVAALGLLVMIGLGIGVELANHSVLTHIVDLTNQNTLLLHREETDRQELRSIAENVERLCRSAHIACKPGPEEGK